MQSKFFSTQLHRAAVPLHASVMQKATKAVVYAAVKMRKPPDERLSLLRITLDTSSPTRRHPPHPRSQT